MRARTRFGRAVGALLALLVAVGALSGCAVTAAGNEDGRKVVGLAVANLQADFLTRSASRSSARPTGGACAWSSPTPRATRTRR